MEYSKAAARGNWVEVWANFDRRKSAKAANDCGAAAAEGGDDMFTRMFDEAIVALDRRLAVLRVRRDAELSAGGWTKSPEGHWVPPGYGPIEGWRPPLAPDGGETPP